jgi:hypothetical protein
MRDPARIPRILDAIRLMWEERPDWRLGQLLVNVMHPSRPTPQIFYYEDTELETRLTSYTGAESPRHTDHEVVLSFTRNEAMVLMAVLMRFRDADKLRVEHPAEQQAMYDLAALVQQHLTDELTSREWPLLLERARVAVLTSPE